MQRSSVSSSLNSHTLARSTPMVAAAASVISRASWCTSPASSATDSETAPAASSLPLRAREARDALVLDALALGDVLQRADDRRPAVVAGDRAVHADVDHAAVLAQAAEAVDAALCILPASRSAMFSATVVRSSGATSASTAKANDLRGRVVAEHRRHARIDVGEAPVLDHVDAGDRLLHQRAKARLAFREALGRARALGLGRAAEGALDQELEQEPGDSNEGEALGDRDGRNRRPAERDEVGNDDPRAGERGIGKGDAECAPARRPCCHLEF
jgi:hypothetical protein